MMLFFLSGSGWNILFPLEIGQNDAIVNKICNVSRWGCHGFDWTRLALAACRG